MSEAERRGEYTITTNRRDLKTDVYVLASHRGQGLSKWLLEVILGHEDLQGLRRFMLATRDAHGLYARFGFKELEKSFAPDGDRRCGCVSSAARAGRVRGCGEAGMERRLCAFPRKRMRHDGG